MCDRLELGSVLGEHWAKMPVVINEYHSVVELISMVQLTENCVVCSIAVGNRLTERISFVRGKTAPDGQ